MKTIIILAAVIASGAWASERPIGVFDSGTGGLTVLEKLLAADAFDNVTGEPCADGKPDFSSENFVYFGDQANMPYGLYDAEGKADFLRELVVRDAQFVLGHEGHAPAKIIVIACNTATAYGLEAATETAKPKGVKVIGVVNAGVAATMDALDAKKGMAPFAVGVIATPGTIASGVYERTLRAEFGARGITGYEIANRGGIGLAEAVENDEPGMKDCARTNFVALVEDYRARGGKVPMRAVILGCTHYPFVLSVFQETLAALRTDPKYSGLLAEDLVFVDPAVYTAIQCFRALKADKLLNRKGAGTPRVKAFMSVGRNGPLSHAVKYGRSVGQQDIGTKIVPMTDRTMSADAVKRLRALLPESAKEIFPAPCPAAGPTDQSRKVEGLACANVPPGSCPNNWQDARSPSGPLSHAAGAWWRRGATNRAVATFRSRVVSNRDLTIGGLEDLGIGGLNSRNQECLLIATNH